MARLALVSGALVLLAACGGGPRFDTSEVALSVTPRQAASDPERFTGTRVLWGGVIVNTVNLEAATRLEVLAYPLGDSQRPRTSAKALDRFLARKPGFLEPADFAPGRQVTVMGPIAAVQSGQVGEAPYAFPVVRIEDLHLWPEERPARRSGFHFGIGILFGN